MSYGTDIVRLILVYIDNFHIINVPQSTTRPFNKQNVNYTLLNYTN